MQGRQIQTQHVYSTKCKLLPLPWWKWSSIINLPAGSWLIPPGNDAISGTQCRSLLLSDWALCSGHSQISCAEYKSMSLSPSITSIPATMATLFMSPLGNDKGGWGKRLTGLHRMGHSIYLIIKNLLYWGHTLLNGHIRPNNIILFQSFREVYPHTYSPNFFVIIFLIVVLPSLWPSHQAIGHSPWIVHNHTSGHFSFQEKWTSRCAA